jgi:hypothetical protein
VADPLTWARLEPDSRDKSLTAGLEARVHDPLWLLARQRQLGELTADGDLGAAVTAELTAELAPLSAYRAGAPNGASALPYDLSTAPLQAVVEAEAVRAAPSARLRARAGLQFLRLLAARGLDRYEDAYRAHYALGAPDAVPDASSRRFLAVVAGRAPDGAQLYADLAAALRPADGGEPTLPGEPPIDPADVGDVAAAGQAFLGWLDTLFAEPLADGDAWTAARMEYAFAVEAAASDGAITLEADEYSDGRLDWHAFDSTGPGEQAPGEATTIGPITLVPSPVGYPGMPARRFWEFEDATVDFGGVAAEPSDIGRMLLTEFALVFGADWLLLPLEVPLGSLVRIVSLDVRDTFGRTLRVGPTSALEGTLGGWRMFTLTRDGDPPETPAPFDDALLVPPVLVGGLQGVDLEEVLLLRDETANLAWAVEKQIEGQNGMPVDRAQALYETAGSPAPPPPEPANTLAYRLSGDVPEYWLPLLPQRERPGDPSIGLRLGALERTLPDGGNEPIPPLGRLLQPPGGGLVLPEEEVPREGARVTRGYRLARWVDGSTFLWLGRRKGVGRGEGSSGLRYDSLEPPASG